MNVQGPPTGTCSQYTPFPCDVPTYQATFGEYRCTVRPRVCVQPKCRAEKPLHKHGDYPRTVKDVEGVVFDIWVMRFRCGACGRTVSILPSFCVPYKRHCSATIAAFLHLVLQVGRGLRGAFGQFPESVIGYRGVAQAWLRQWYHNRIVLIQDGLPRLGMSLGSAAGFCGSSPYVTLESTQCYGAVYASVGGGAVPGEGISASELFMHVQPVLSRDYPPVGLFRPSLTSSPD